MKTHCFFANLISLPNESSFNKIHMPFVFKIIYKIYVLVEFVCACHSVFVLFDWVISLKFLISKFVVVFQVIGSESYTLSVNTFVFTKTFDIWVWNG